ncbi:hypothetical protein DPEC_G00027420 [Dallia pectoralis]|uniref:Uncharacterized protein n=1 Tax=Dallia pectoralis TaxID=75939 RepID=A0ACC2HJA0_DALPE|nr:hypothetical protein DPEC_G00027420 [Dallia pectoralis]
MTEELEIGSTRAYKSHGWLVKNILSVTVGTAFNQDLQSASCLLQTMVGFLVLCGGPNKIPKCCYKTSSDNLLPPTTHSEKRQHLLFPSFDVSPTLISSSTVKTEFPTGSACSAVIPNASHVRNIHLESIKPERPSCSVSGLLARWHRHLGSDQSLAAKHSKAILVPYVAEPLEE